MVRNCFTDNVVSVAPVSIQGSSTLVVNSNYHSNSAGGRCDLAAKFVTGSAFENFTPECTSFDATECQIFDTEAPSVTPTTSPSKLPTQGFVQTGQAQPTPSPVNPGAQNVAQSSSLERFSFIPFVASLLSASLLI